MRRRALTFLYRGPLSSCNYACDYCPFAKRRESATEHGRDALALDRFVGWLAARRGSDSVFFTPWGEALIRRRYQRAMVRLSRLPGIAQVVIQTNLSCRLDWLEECDRAKVQLWATWHPSQVDLERFLDRSAQVVGRGVAMSVGVVGMREHLPALEELRRRLPASTYLWVNAYKRVPDYYSDQELERLQAVDPLFSLNNLRHPSLGRACRTGMEVLSVAGDGGLRRCHFVSESLGNLYQPGWEERLTPRPCPQESCGCFIGYAHLEHLGLRELYGSSLLARIPRIDRPNP